MNRYLINAILLHGNKTAEVFAFLCESTQLSLPPPPKKTSACTVTLTPLLSSFIGCYTSRAIVLKIKY